jgi:hypothetical protein
VVSETAPIVIYESGEGGYGDAISAGRRSYAMTMNMDNRVEGRAVLSVVPKGMGLRRADIPREVGAAFEWETSAGVPFILIAGADVSAGTVKRSVSKLQDGEFTLEDSETGVGYTGGFLYQHDGADADAAAAFFCNGDDQEAIRRRKIDGTYATADDAKADLLAVVGSHGWRTLGHKISKLLINTSPGTAANYGTQIPAGRATYEINTVLELGGSPLLQKGDGVFKYNPAPSAATFQNMTSFVSAHKDNGKGGFTDGRGRVYYFTVDGDVLVVSFGTQSQQRPTRFTKFDRDTPFGRIGAMTADANHVYAAIEPGSVRSQVKELGIKVLLFDASAGAFSDVTAGVTDKKKATSANLGSIGDADDFIYVGSEEPMAGTFWEVLAANTGAAQPFQQAEFSKGSDTWGNVPVRDSTMAFTQDGCIAVLTG